jgi:anti-sigma factor RsiW
MHFSEDDLRAALKRQDPGEGFTQRVMARVNQASGAPEKPARRFWLWQLRPALAALAAVLLLVAGLGLAYRHQQTIQQARAKKAQQEAVLALRIANTTLNRVLERVSRQQANQPKVRREML